MCPAASRLVTSFPNLGNSSVTSEGRRLAHASRHAWTAGHALLATFQSASLNLLTSERNLTLHLKRMICVGAAVMGLAATASVASASAAITEAGSSLVYPLVYKWSHVYTGGSRQRRCRRLGRRNHRHQRIEPVGQHRRIRRADEREPVQRDSHSPVEIPWALSASRPSLQHPRHPCRPEAERHDRRRDLHRQDHELEQLGDPEAEQVRQLKALKKAPKITPVFRSDGSGDSFVFQNFLFKGAPKVWTVAPVDRLPRHRRPGRERQLRRRPARSPRTPAPIGYISAYYALSQHGIYPASLENAAGKFEQANGATIEAAAKSNSTIPAQGSAFTSAGGVPIQYPSKKYKTAYPISTYTYAIVNKGRERRCCGLQSFLSLGCHDRPEVRRGAEVLPAAGEHRLAGPEPHQRALGPSSRHDSNTLGPGRQTGARVV